MIKLRPWSSIGKEEEAAALRVLRSSTLSGFLGGVQDGGPEVQALEREWSELNGGCSVAVNSATSGILIALKAVGVGPGSRVICSPYSMSAGVACVLWLGAIPVFADIDNTYCLDPNDVREIINRYEIDIYGGFILTTNLFGGVASHELTESGIPIIEDNAQAPLTHRYYGSIAVDSFNVHKPIQCGEGGICTTRDPDLAYDLKLLRNHGELGSEYPEPSLEVGLNLRITEISAAIAREQIKKGQGILNYRRSLIKRMVDGLGQPYRVAPFDPDNAYYVFPIRVDASIRDQMVKGLQERGVPVRAGYGGPLYNLPAFKPYARECPNCERIERELIILEMYAHDYTPEIIDQIVEAFHEVSHEVVR